MDKDKDINDGKQYNLTQIIVLHLLPGVPVILIAILLANPSIGFGLPIFLSLIIAFSIGLIPTQWIILKIVAHKEGKKIKDIIGYMEKMSWQKIIVWSLPCIVFAAIIFTVGTKIESPLWTIFSWVPKWFIVNRFEINAGNLFLLTIFLNFIIRGLLVPFTEEIYFRGFLLPRMKKLGIIAPVVSSALFSLYHLFAPWENVTRMIAVLPFVYIVWYKRNVRVGIISHCFVNTLSCIGMFIL